MLISYYARLQLDGLNSKLIKILCVFVCVCESVCVENELQIGAERGRRLLERE